MKIWIKQNYFGELRHRDLRGPLRNLNLLWWSVVTVGWLHCWHRSRWCRWLLWLQMAWCGRLWCLELAKGGRLWWLELAKGGRASRHRSTRACRMLDCRFQGWGQCGPYRRYKSRLYSGYSGRFDRRSRRVWRTRRDLSRYHRRY